MEGPDVFQHSDVILLWNVAALFFVSISTDYWQYKTVDFGRLEVDLNAFNITGKSYKFQGLMVVDYIKPQCRDHCGLRYIYQEHKSLFKTCNELQENHRMVVAGVSTRCRYFIFNSTWWDQQPADSKGFDQAILGLIGTATLLLVISCIIGSCGAVRNNFTFITSAGCLLVFFDIFLLISLACFVVKIQLQNQRNAAIVVPSGPEVPLDRLSDRSVKFEFGWSFAAACCCLSLGVIGAYVFFASGNAIRLRRKTIQRRMRVRTMLMSSCQPDIALAVRAKLVYKDRLID